MTAARRRVAASAAALSAGGLSVLPEAASADLLAPDSPASASAGAMRTIYLIMAVVALLVALAVIAAILRAVAGSRRRGAEPERRTMGTSGVQRRVGIGLGVAALVLFVVGVVFTERAREVDAAESSAEPVTPVTIYAFGQQWLWRYEYPVADPSPDGYSGETPYSFYELVVPVDTPIELQVGSTDVLHRWWVPALGRSAEAVPGDLNPITFTADEVGTYEGRSTEFSGPGYATMRTAVHVVSADEYQAFLEERTKEIVEARNSVQDRVEAGTAPGVELEQ